MIIYKQYTQQDLDKQYNNRAAVPDFAQIVAQWQQQSQAVRQKSAIIADLPYGNHQREQLDIFPAGQSDAPVQVFFHGGYWQAMDKSVFHFIAESFVSQGITTVLVNYPLMPQVTMTQLVDACRRAMAWLYRHLADYDANPDKIYISGHSAGGHIVAMLITTHWPQLDESLPNQLIKGGCAISGLFNLEPIRLCYLNDVLAMDQAMARQNSPVFLSPAGHSPLIVTVGGLESNEYHAQSQELVDAWQKHPLPITHLPVPNANHFSILDHLTDETKLLRQTILKQMQLTGRSNATVYQV